MTANNEPQNIEPVNEQDLQSFAQKLQAWGEGLPNHERALLQVLLTNAESGGEIQGYGQNFAFSSPSILAQMTPLVFRGIGVSADGDAAWTNAHWMNGNFQGMPGGIQQRL